MKRIERFCGDNPLVSIVSLGFFQRLAGGRGQMRAFWPHTRGRWGHYRWNGWIISWKFSWSVATVKASRDKLVVVFDQSVIFGIVVVLVLMVHTVVEMLLLLLFLENHWTRTEKKRIKIILFWKFHNFVGQNILLRFTFIMFIFVNINLVTLPLLPKTFYWWCLQRRMNGNTHLGGKTSTRWEWQKSTRKRGTPYSSTLTQGFTLVSSQFEKCWILLNHTLLI